MTLFNAGHGAVSRLMRGIRLLDRKACVQSTKSPRDFLKEYVPLVACI